MDWAVTHGYRLDNPAGRSLLKVLPPVKRLKKHHAALPYEQVPGALAQVQESKAHALTKLALEFLVLTAHPHRLGDGPKRPEGKHNIELVFGKPAGNRSRQIHLAFPFVEVLIACLRGKTASAYQHQFLALPVMAQGP